MSATSDTATTPVQFRQELSALALEIKNGRATPEGFACVESLLKTTEFADESARIAAARDLGGLRLLAAVAAVA